jgi:hypothetical protein
MATVALNQVDEPINLRLHPKQSLAYQSTATEILYGGSKYGGKSHLSRVAAILWAADISGLQVYMFRKTFPDLWRNHMTGPGSFFALLSPWIRQGWVTYNGSKNYWNFWNGSQIHLCHCQHDQDMQNYQGAEIHVLMIDQLEQWAKDVYKFLRAQVRLGGLNLPEEYIGQFPRILNSANPGGVGHNWVKADFVDVAPEMHITQMPEDEGGMLRQYIPARLEDNPTGRRLDPNYESRLMGLGSPAMVKALRWGLWDIVSGGAIDDVWRPEIHVIPPFQIPLNWWVERSFDWGSSKPFSVGWWARADGSTVHTAFGPRTFHPGTKIRVAEFYGWNGKDPDVGCKMIAAEVARRILEIEKHLPFKRIHPGPADASIFDSDSTIADDMARVGIKWTMADKRPGSRQAGLEKLRSMLKACLVIDEETHLPVMNPDTGKAQLKSPMDEPGLFVFDTCRHFIRTVPTLPRDQRKADDVDSTAEDHIYDETRYEIMTPPRLDVVEQAAI